MNQKKSEESGDRLQKAQPAESSKQPLQKSAKAKKAEPSKRSPKKPDEPRTDWVQRIRQYLKEVSHELKKVVWPSRKETIGSTSVVLVIVILSGVFLGMVDLILSRFVRMLIG